MKYPITIKYLGLEAKIYRSSIKGKTYYRAIYGAGGRRVTKACHKLKEARAAALEGLENIHNGHDEMASLSKGEAGKVQVALQLLKGASGVARELKQAFQIDCCDLGRKEVVMLFDSLKAKSPTWRNHHRYVLRGIVKHAIQNQ